MSFAINELKRLLEPPQAIRGVVVNLKGTIVRVATERGAVDARPIDTVSVGDRVLIKNGIAIKAPNAERIFHV